MQDDDTRAREAAQDPPPEASSFSKHSIAERDLKALFSGSPYFFLEKGKHDMWHPQVIFPFDDHDPSIQNMWDRKPLAHASYTLATLHAHLPIPDGWVVQGDTPINLSNWRKTDAPKRGAFDLGVFEVPNMLARNGREPGSVGFRHFLEVPVADSVVYPGPEMPKPRPEMPQFDTLPATEAFELMERYNEPYCECDDGTVHDRKQLLCDGPTAWKRIGVREISLKNLVDRLEKLRMIRHEALYGQTPKTLLDAESPRELYNTLFKDFLHHPPQFLKSSDDDHHGIKFQIKVLTIVLATPGAWFNFSIPEWRFRVGQVLWESPPHLDGDFLDPGSCDDANRRSWISSGLERKWLLIQMLLAGELLLRLDAVVRLGVMHQTDDLAITQQDVRYFDELRTGKVNWDLIVVRRFFDSFSIGQVSTPEGGSPQDKPDGKTRHFSFFENLAHKVTASMHHDTRSARECRLSPIHAKKQVAGLLVFAENIGWPNLERLKAHLNANIEDGDISRAGSNIYSGPIGDAYPGDRELKLGESMYDKSLSRRLVLLNFPHNQKDTPAVGTGGWVTRSWLSGFVVPGKAIDHMLIGTILENDPEAMNVLGPLANLFGGFSYKERSWWSSECIVGRVLACMDNATSCMGWISSAVLPCNALTSEALKDTWFEVPVKDTRDHSRKSRIKQGHNLAAHSTPLGIGEVSMEAFTLPVDEPSAIESHVEINFQALKFTPKEEEHPEDKRILVSKETTMSFDVSIDSEAPTTVSFSLAYNVGFVTSQECRPPLGLASSRCSHFPGNEQDREYVTVPREHARLPGHPLHKSYCYKYIPLESLPQTPRPHRPSPEKDESGLRRYDVIIIDARGSWAKETFARAWCASVGSHAVIGRAGRTCLACCVREAQALDAAVIIRVGDGARSRPSSIHAIHDKI